MKNQILYVIFLVVSAFLIYNAMMPTRRVWFLYLSDSVFNLFNLTFLFLSNFTLNTYFIFTKHKINSIYTILV